MTVNQAYVRGYREGKALGIEAGLRRAARRLRRRAAQCGEPGTLLRVWADDFMDCASALRRKRVGR